MLHWCLSSVCLSVTPWYRFETVQCSGLKLYRMVGQGLDPYNAERHPKRPTVNVSEQCWLQWGYPLFRVDRGRLTGHMFSYITRQKHRTTKIMATYCRQLFYGKSIGTNPVVRGWPLGVQIKVTNAKSGSCDWTIACRLLVPIGKSVQHVQHDQKAVWHLTLVDLAKVKGRSRTLTSLLLLVSQRLPVRYGCLSAKMLPMSNLVRRRDDLTLNDLETVKSRSQKGRPIPATAGHLVYLGLASGSTVPDKMRAVLKRSRK